MTIDGDVPCHSCGYNLRTSPLTGKCPECSADVIHSLRTDSLAFADRKCLARIRLGILLIFAFPLCDLVFSILSGFLLPPTRVTLMLALWVPIAASVVTCLGICLAVSVERPKDDSVRSIVCWAARVMALASPLATIVHYVLFSYFQLPTWVVSLVPVGFWVAAAIMFVSVMRIAKDTGSRILQRLTDFQIVAIIMFVSSRFLATRIDWSRASGSRVWGDFPVEVVYSFEQWSWYAAMALGGILLIWYYRLLSRALRHSPQVE